MREIKFRVWIGGRFYYWGFRRFPEHARGLSFFAMPSDSKEPLTLEELQERSQQFTGLHDKNGKGVYEGDIIAVNHEGNDGVGVIEWCKNGACFTVDWPPVTMYDLQVDRYYEVVGNIYENPELLGETPEKPERQPPLPEGLMTCREAVKDILYHLNHGFKQVKP